MAQDIRLDDNFFDHPKAVRFLRRTGDHAVACLVRLWCYTSRYFPRGILAGMNPEDIATSAGWKHAPEEFISSLLEAGGPGKSGFIDQCGTQSNPQYAVHNWRKRNPYAYFREERSETSRKAAETRWGKRSNTIINPTPNTESKPKRNTKGSAVGNRPSPIPFPSPKDGEKEKDKLQPALEGAAVRSEETIQGEIQPPNFNFQKAYHDLGLTHLAPIKDTIKPKDKSNDSGNGEAKTFTLPADLSAAQDNIWKSVAGCGKVSELHVDQVAAALIAYRDGDAEAHDVAAFLEHIGIKGIDKAELYKAVGI